MMPLTARTAQAAPSICSDRYLSNSKTPRPLPTRRSCETYSETVLMASACSCRNWLSAQQHPQENVSASLP